MNRRTPLLVPRNNQKQPVQLKMSQIKLQRLNLAQSLKTIWRNWKQKAEIGENSICIPQITHFSSISSGWNLSNLELRRKTNGMNHWNQWIELTSVNQNSGLCLILNYTKQLSKYWTCWKHFEIALIILNCGINLSIESMNTWTEAWS